MKGKRIATFIKACRAACTKPGCPGRIPHDLRRTAVRNPERASVPERVAMQMTGRRPALDARDPDRKAPRFVAALQRIARRYRTATTIHLTMDNLNLHSANALIRTLGATHGSALWARFRPPFTPQHGSWLNPAEIEASLWSRECHGRDRVDSFEALRDRTRAHPLRQRG